MKQLLNKVVFLTGGAAGIGRACAEAYYRQGARVFIMDRDRDSLEQMINMNPDAYTGFTGDVSSEKDVRQAFNIAEQTFGTIDVIHNNAGIAHPSKSIDQTSEDEWDSLMNTNLKSIFWTTKFGIAHLKQRKGCILNTSSMTGEIGQSLHAAYTATKGGINALTKSMALDYAQFGIRVNAISPAGVWTPLLREWALEQPEPEKIEQYLAEIHVLGYCPDADVVADAAVFLISDASRFITGCIMPVSGGAELGYRK